MVGLSYILFYYFLGIGRNWKLIAAVWKPAQVKLISCEAFPINLRCNKKLLARVVNTSLFKKPSDGEDGNNEGKRMPHVGKESLQRRKATVSN